MSKVENDEGANRIYLFSFRPYQILLFDIPADLPFTVSKDDKMAMFMGDTCVGVGVLDETAPFQAFTEEVYSGVLQLK